MKKGLWLSILVLSALLWANNVKASELTNDYFDIATNYYNSNNYAKALEYLDLIITIEPSNTQAKSLRDKISPSATGVETVQETVNILNSVQSPENVVVIQPAQPEAPSVAYDSDYYNTKGQEFYQKKDFNTAAEYFYKSIALNHKNFQAYNNLAMAYWAKNNLNCAIKYFKKAYSINNNYTQPLANLSNLYKQLGDKDKQFCYLCKAIKHNPNDYLAYYWLGDYYKTAGDYPKAIENYKEVEKINPKFSQSYLNLAICFFETEEFNYCLMALSQYNELCPNSDFSYYLMARTNLALCRYDDAKDNIEKAIQLKDTSAYQFELAKIDYYLEDYEAALNIFQDLLKSYESAEYFNYVALCNYKMKNIEIAIINFKKAIDLDALRPIYYYNLAQCYKSLGDKKNYVKYVNSATKINPINYQDFIDLSYIYYDNGNPGYAINSLNNAIKRYPTVKSLYLSKLKIYEVMGDNLHYNETKDSIEMRFNRK